MRRLPAPLRLRPLLLCLGLLFGCAAIGLAQEQAPEPIRVGDRIDVTLTSGAEFTYAKVIEVTKDSLIVANSQGVREFQAKFLTPDLRARLPGAQPKPVAPPAPQPLPQATPAPLPVATPPPAPVDLDALAEVLLQKINAQQPAAPSPTPLQPAAATAPGANNGPWEALLFGLILIIPTLNVLATRHVILSASGPAVPVWILAIWLLPVVGCLSAFTALGRPAAPAKS